MLKLESCRLMSLDVDKWEALACYDDMTGDALDPALVQAARALEVEYLKKMKVYDVVSRRELKKANHGKLIREGGSISTRAIRFHRTFARGTSAKSSPQVLMLHCVLIHHLLKR